MADPIPMLIYFLGPLALALAARRFLGTSFAAFRAGLLTFLLAWICVTVVTQAITVSSPAAAPGSIRYTIVVAAAAALFEEVGRFVAFRAFPSLRGAPTWRTGITYAVGHSGMESFIVGASLALTLVVVTHSPELLTPEQLVSSQAMLGAGVGEAIYAAFERVLVGGLMHSCFTLVVLLGILRGQRRYLGLAILWHFMHDLVAQNLERLSVHWLAHAAWIAFILVGYTWLLIRLARSANASPRDADARVLTAQTVS